MDQYKETFNTWNAVAQLYEDKFMALDIYDDSYNLLLSRLSSEAKILDVGCGPGNITRYLLSKNKSLTITGIDISENMIDLASKNNPEASFDVMDIRQLNQIDEKFNAIICGFCLPYLSDKYSQKLFSDSAFILEDKGLLYLSFVPGNSKDSGFIVGSSGDRAYFYYHEIEFINKELARNGFKILETLEVNFQKAEDKNESHLIIIAKKE